jgi:hypothetical protein
MIKYGQAELNRYPMVAERAQSVARCVGQVVKAVKNQDQSPINDSAVIGQVHIQESGVSVKNGKIDSLETTSSTLLTSNPEVCLSNDKLPVRIQGDDRVIGFKGLLADLTSDGSGKTLKATVQGAEFYPHGMSTNNVYSYSRDDKHNREIFTSTSLGHQETTIVNSDGTIAQFRVGSPSLMDKLHDKIGR